MYFVLLTIFRPKCYHCVFVLSVEMVYDEKPRIKKKNKLTFLSGQVEMWDKTANGGGMLLSGSSMLRGVTDGGGTVASSLVETAKTCLWKRTLGSHVIGFSSTCRQCYLRQLLFQ
jgi:hypothetical protein